MPELTDEWLEKINEGFSKNDIPHQRRPWFAWAEWGRITGSLSSLNDEDVEKIFSWFDKNTKAGSQQVGSMYAGAYYYDSCFWPVVVPIVFGTVRLSPREFLKTMPESIITRLWSDRKKLVEYVSVFVDCVDYALGLEDIQKSKTLGQFAKDLLRSGDQQLKAVVSLVLESSPNSKSIESARMSTEMYLKAFLAVKAALTETDAKDNKKFGHNLTKALGACLSVDANSELKTILPNLKIFPTIVDRYKGTEKTPKELWQAYSIAQFVGTTVVRSLSGRDMRGTINVTTG
jgi:hypothetical protein